MAAGRARRESRGDGVSELEKNLGGGRLEEAAGGSEADTEPLSAAKAAAARPVGGLGARVLPLILGPEHGLALDLLKLAVPIIAMALSRLLMTFIDFAMVSQLGTEAQAAISPASFLIFTVGCVAMGVAQAVQTFVAQADGRRDRKVVGAYAWQSYYIAGAFAIVILPLSLTTESWFAYISAAGQHPPAMAKQAAEYIQICLWSTVPAVLCIGLNGLFNGIQKPRITVVATVVSLVVNVIGNWLLIFGNLGFPRLEMAGAAIATVLAWAARCVVLAWAMLRPELDGEYNTRRTYAPDLAKLRELARVGLPMSVQWLIDIGSFLVFLMLIVPPFGVHATAASNIGMQCMHLAFMPPIGMAIALSSKVGYAIGERNLENARRYVRLTLRLNLIYMVAMGVLFLLAGGSLISIFNGDPEVIRVGGQIMLWVAVLQAFDAVAITYMNALRGAGDTRVPAVYLAIAAWGVFIGGGYAVALLAPQFGASGPWMMCAAHLAVLGALLWHRWGSGAWSRVRIFDEPAAPQPPLTEPAAGPLLPEGSHADPGPERSTGA